MRRYYFSWVRTLRKIYADRLEAPSELIASMQAKSTNSDTTVAPTIYSHLGVAFQSLVDSLAVDPSDGQTTKPPYEQPFRFLRSNDIEIAQFKRDVKLAYSKRKVNHYRETATDKQRANFLSLQNGGLSWYGAIPSNEGLTLRPHEYNIALRLALGLKPTNTKLPPNAPCVCNSQSTAAQLRSNVHLTACPHGGWPKRRHDRIRSTLAYWARLAGRPVKEEPRGEPTLMPGHMGADLRIDRASGLRDYYDITIVHPTQQSMLPASAASVHHAARKAFTSKVNKYSQYFEAEPDAKFTPLVMEVRGSFHKEFQAFLLDLSHEIVANFPACNALECPNWAAPSVAMYMRQQISVMLQQSVAAQILEAERLILGRQEEVMGYSRPRSRPRPPLGTLYRCVHEVRTRSMLSVTAAMPLPVPVAVV